MLYKKIKLFFNKKFLYNVKVLFLDKPFVQFCLVFWKDFYDQYKLHKTVFVKNGFIIYFQFMKNDFKFYIIIFYSLYILSRGGICLSMLAVRLGEAGVEGLTNGVINEVVEKTNLSENIIQIPSLKMEEMLAHDINIFDIRNERFDLYEIKVLCDKKNLSCNELVDLRIRYSYTKNIFIGYDSNIEDSEIIKNIDFINREKDIFKFFKENFGCNRQYYINKFILNSEKNVLNGIIEECNIHEGCNIREDLKRKDLLNLYHENEWFARKINSKLEKSLENYSNIDNYDSYNKHFINKKNFCIQKDLYDYEFSTEIKPVRVNVQQIESLKLKPGILDSSKYNKQLIENRNNLWMKFLKNIKK